MKEIHLKKAKNKYVIVDKSNNQDTRLEDSYLSWVSCDVSQRKCHSICLSYQADGFCSTAQDYSFGVLLSRYLIFSPIITFLSVLIASAMVSTKTLRGKFVVDVCRAVTGNQNWDGAQCFASLMERTLMNSKPHMSSSETETNILT